MLKMHFSIPIFLSVLNILNFAKGFLNIYRDNLMIVSLYLLIWYMILIDFLTLYQHYIPRINPVLELFFWYHKSTITCATLCLLDSLHYQPPPQTPLHSMSISVVRCRRVTTSFLCVAQPSP